MLSGCGDEGGFASRFSVANFEDNTKAILDGESSANENLFKSFAAIRLEKGCLKS
jgi:hypothetical protein